MTRIVRRIGPAARLLVGLVCGLSLVAYRDCHAQPTVASVVSLSVTNVDALLIPPPLRRPGSAHD